MKRNPLIWKLAVLSLAVLASCVATGLRCPDLCFNNDHCRHDLFCAKWVGVCDGLGMCVPRPQACPEIYDPVCGCDGLTYSNDCFANAAGVNILHEGPCESLTCLSNEDCSPYDPSDSPNAYCAKDVGDCEGLGMCTERPEECILIYLPVCGCDGNTYSNACEAAREGINVLADVSCDEILCDPVDCGPPPAMPNYLCEDGTLAGPTGRCRRGPEGVCGWEIRDCPS
jgi:hypothetical protein